MRWRMLAVALAAGAAMSACGSPEQAQNALAPGPPPPPPVAVPSEDGSVELGGSPAVEQIKQRGKLLVGLRSDDPRMVQRVGAGEYRGFDVEIAGILASGMGLDPAQVSFRWLPPAVRTNAMTAGSVDVQLGGFAQDAPQFAKAGPYAVTGDGAEHYVGFPPGDDAMREELQRILDAAVADGRWQRAYDGTLGAAGVQARPAP